MLNWTHRVHFERDQQDGVNLVTPDTLVEIVAISPDAQLQTYSADFIWTVRFKLALAFIDPSGTIPSSSLRIQTGDFILWDGLQKGRGTLRKPKPIYGLKGYAQAAFDEEQ